MRCQDPLDAEVAGDPRECMTLRAAPTLKAKDVLDTLVALSPTRGAHKHVRGSNRSESTAHLMERWLAHVSVATLFMEPASTWEIGFPRGHDDSRDPIVVREPMVSPLRALDVFVFHFP